VKFLFTLLSVSAFAFGQLPVPDVIVWGKVDQNDNSHLPQTMSWSVSDGSTTNANLAVEWFEVAGVSYYVACIPFKYHDAPNTSDQFVLTTSDSTLELTFTDIDGVEPTVSSGSTTFTYGLSQFGVIHRVDLDISATSYERWISELYPDAPLSILDPDADTDGDGVSNYDEFLAGTDPTNVHIYPGMLNRDWWVKRGVINPEKQSVHNAAVLTGQLKNFTYQGLEEVEEKYPEIAHLIRADIEQLTTLDPDQSEGNYGVANIGQAKAMSAPFFEHLNLPKPWVEDQLPTNIHAINQGQLKHLFDFPIDFYRNFSIQFDNLSQQVSYPVEYGNQGSGGALVIEGESLKISGNAWKAIKVPGYQHPYFGETVFTLTEKTIRPLHF